jgi:hypothetical protein
LRDIATIFYRAKYANLHTVTCPEGEILGQRKYRFRHAALIACDGRDTIDPFVNFPVSGTRCIDPGNVRPWSASAAALVKIPPSRSRSPKIGHLQRRVPPGTRLCAGLADRSRHLPTSVEMPKRLLFENWVIHKYISIFHISARIINAQSHRPCSLLIPMHKIRITITKIRCISNL